jgi:hypothetical protein
MTSLRTPFDGPPLDPSSAQAQQWVRDELAKGRYHTEPSLLQRFLDWLRALFDHSLGLGQLPSWAVLLVVVVILAVLVLVVLRLVRPEAVTRRRSGPAAPVDEEGLSAADYRVRARGSADRGDWDAVLLDAYRALAASAVERTLLTELPGRTAHEVAISLTVVFPEHVDALESAAAAFDDVRYGHREATRARAIATTELDAELFRTRPVLGTLVAP